MLDLHLSLIRFWTFIYLKKSLNLRGPPITEALGGGGGMCRKPSGNFNHGTSQAREEITVA